ncbi:hypothetical protein ONZ45_g2778 [Pleurotus djamor]|nr:hypothetical protein ONZ45_g2778 [Pleurotus djamor]
MSRLTAAQVIGLGEYLKPDFDPATLTVSQLLGVLGFHNVPYPQPYTKPKLVQTFNNEIKANAKKLAKERLKKENSIASDEGILDGVTGEPVASRKAEPPPPRRSSRRLSRAPVEIDAPPVRPEPPKRRRSSAQPSLGGSSHRTARASAFDSLAEESELEEEDLPIRKVVRSKKSSQAGSQARRVSQPMTEESGWEDNNIFQSGAESSPQRPSPSRPKVPRRSGVPRKSRKSMSAPPQVQPSPSSSPTRPRQYNIPDSPFSPPQSKFQPQLPPSVSRETRIISSKLVQPLELPIRESSEPGSTKPSPSDDELDFLGPPARPQETIEEGISDLGSQDESPSVPSAVVLSGGDVVLHPALDPTPPSRVSRLILLLLLCGCLASTINYKLESSPIGYCDAGSNTNTALEVQKANIAALGTCLPENITFSEAPEFLLDHFARDDHSNCTLSPLMALPHPTTCTPCPEHASHPLLFFLPPATSPSTIKLSSVSSPSDVAWKIISQITDGLPLFGSVAFPPRCVEDPRRKRNIGVGGSSIDESNGGDARKWGLQIDALRDELRQKTKAKASDTFAEEFNEAIQQLIQWGGVIFSEDSEGKRYLAHKVPDLTWKCAVFVNLRQFWEEWRTAIFGLVMAVIGLYTEKLRRGQRYRERLRAAELVQVALDALRNQELAHHTDPVTAPQPYLSSLQLRDLILQDEHSIDRRKRIWHHVEIVVESNANVRTNLEEVVGGDEMRVWRWVGTTGASPTKKATATLMDTSDGQGVE